MTGRGLTAAGEAPTDSAAPAAVRVRGLVKRFGDVVALDGLDLTLERGAFYAFLGPNGAGKSTAISILTGLYAPDAGAIEILGLDARAQPLEVKRHVGVVPEELALFERLTGEQHLTFAGRLHGLPGPVAAARADELLALTALEQKRDRLVAEYSKGMRRRLAIAAALVHAPRLLFLDEPFEGIDILAANVIRELLAELSRRGVTLLLTTHVLEIAERFATHAGILSAGKLLDEGPVAELRARHGQTSLEGVFLKLIGVPASRHARLSFYAGEAAKDA